MSYQHFILSDVWICSFGCHMHSENSIRQTIGCQACCWYLYKLLIPENFGYKQIFGTKFMNLYKRI